MSPSFDDLLAQDVASATPGFGVALKVAKNGYNQLVQHSNLRTYSTTEVLHACPRKYAIKKMQAHINSGERINSPTFAFGHAVGAGVAVYDKTQDLRQAIWSAFLAWDIDLLDSERKPGMRAGKSFYEAVWALYAYENFYQNESDLSSYEVVNIEATIAVDFEDGSFYSGHIDEVLRHKYSGELRIKENKTDGSVSIDPAKYSNSDQALSYAIVVDMLGGADYSVLYTIYCVPDQRWVSFDFVKDANKKAEWIQDQLSINQHVDDYAELKFFPKRGHSCMNFNRRCEFYETCDLSFRHAYGKEFKELPRIQSLGDIEAIEHIDFPTTVSAIVQRQHQKLNQG